MASIPSNLSYTREDIAKAASRKKFKEGWYCAVVMDATPKVVPETVQNESMRNQLQISTRVAVLADPNDSESLTRETLFHTIPSPIANPDVIDHVVPDWAPSMCKGAIHAYFDAEELPRIEKDDVTKEYSFDGRNELDAIVIDAETKDTIDRAIIKQETIRDTGGLL